MLESDSVVYENLIRAIVHQQEEIIGPVALAQAKTVEGIKVRGNDITFDTNNPKKTLEYLVFAYAELFGRASVELSKEAISKVKAPSDILPDILVK